MLAQDVSGRLLRASLVATTDESLTSEPRVTSTTNDRIPEPGGAPFRRGGGDPCDCGSQRHICNTGNMSVT